MSYILVISLAIVLKQGTLGYFVRR